MIKKILVVDDEPLIRNFLNDSLVRLKKEVHLAQNGQEAISLLDKENFDLVITDMKIPQKNGLDILKYAKKINPTIYVIIITAYGNIENVVEAMKLGAFNYLIKPFTFDVIETIIKKAQEHSSLISENTFLKQQFISNNQQNIIFQSLFMKNMLKNIDKISNSSSSVFISGESGTGKEVIAKLIHQRSNRKENPFIKVNCAAISPTLLESEFFGHEKGAFTGAVEQKKGRFELANNGTLLLDEITEIPPNLQAKLLRALQEQEFERVGNSKPIKVDIRFISTTNKNIKNAIKDNLFREDLFYRLNVIPIHIAPLRERKEDIIPLASFFIEKFCIENHKPLKKISPSAKEKLLNYNWPGNVRELANIIERTIVMDLHEIIEKDHIILDTSSCDHINEENNFYGKSLSEVEKILILKTLENQNFSRCKTAKILGITTRTLRNKIKLYKSN